VGLGLAALAALLILLPGFCFTYGFGRVSNPASPSTIIDQHVTVALVISLAWAIFAHLIFLAISFEWATWMHVAPPDPSLILPVLAGDTEHADGVKAIESVREHYFPISAYFLAVSAGSKYLGQLANLLWPKAKGGPADWHALLSGDDVDFIVLTSDGKIDDTCYLFTGVLGDFFVGPSGRLERIVLRYAARRAFSGADALIPRGHPLGDGWVEIPGEYLVLNLTEQTTVNVDYFFFEDDDFGPVQGDEDPEEDPAADEVGD
jgi:hypothetical protein